MERVDYELPDFIAIDWKIDIAGDRSTAQISFVLLPTSGPPGNIEAELSPRLGFRYVELKKMHADLGNLLDQMQEGGARAPQVQ